MLDFLFTNTADTALTAGSAVLTLGAAFLLGLIISFTYMKTCRDRGYSQGFVLTIIMVPAIIAIIILLVGSNVARAFSLAGAFSIIRFRSAPGNPKDITYIFFAMAAGLACGVGLIGYALLFTVLLCAFMVVLYLVKFGVLRTVVKHLKITIPEDLNYEGVFEDILKEYTESHRLLRVRTTDLGSLYELQFEILPKAGINEKEFLDLVRCRNGNLNITLSLAEAEGT